MYRVLVQHSPKPKPPIPSLTMPPKLQAFYDLICETAEHGARLPSGIDLARMYGVSPARISHMTTNLLNRGLVERRRVNGGPRDERRDRYIFTVIDTGKTTA